MFAISKGSVIALFAALAIMILSACSKDEIKNLDLTKTKSVEALKGTQVKKLRIAIGGMITPKEGHVYYRDFLDFLGSEAGIPVEYVGSESYEEINGMLEKREIDAAIVCSGPYVDGHSRFGLELLAAPQVHGSTVYYSYIIVSQNSSAQSLDDLKGKSFAFTDPLSNSGKLVPEYMISKKGSNSNKFFKNIVFSGSHDKSIKAVADKLVDGAAVDSLIWEYLNVTKPELTRKTRVLMKSEPFAIPPFVVHPSLNPDIKKKLEEAVLNAHNKPKGKEILDKMMIEKYVKIDDSAYNSIRDIKKWIAKQENVK